MAEVGMVECPAHPSGPILSYDECALCAPYGEGCSCFCWCTNYGYKLYEDKEIDMSYKLCFDCMVYCYSLPYWWVTEG